MLTPEQIAALRDAAGHITDPINDFLVDDIARRVSEAGQLTSTAAYQVWQVQQLGLSQRQLKKELRKRLKVSHRELRKILTQTAEVGYDFDIKRLPFVQAVPFAANESLQQIVAAAVALAGESLTNMTKTLGMVDPFGRALPLQDVYRSCTDFAFKQVVTGATDYNTAIRTACANIAKYGVRTIDYESGVHTSLEAAVRRNIMGGLGLMNEQITQQNHDDLGCDGWEISAHANSAPDHEPIQGKQYSDAEYTALNNSLVRRIGTLNCGHVAFPIILGVNSPQYTPEQLRQFREDNEKGITYEGRHYTGYEATQMQRKIERSIRAQKNRILIDEATGDAEKLQTDRIKLRQLNAEYKRFSAAAGLRTEPERAQVAGFGKKKTVAKNAGTGTIFKENRVFAGEQDLVDKPLETGIIYDSTGKELLRKQGSVGEVRFTREEANLLEGNIFSHNHPSNGPLSDADLYGLWKNRASEIRAVTSHGVFSIRQPNTWKRTPDRKTLRAEFEANVRRVYNPIARRLDSGLLIAEEADYLIQRIAMRRITRRYGVKMELIPWEK